MTDADIGQRHSSTNGLQETAFQLTSMQNKGTNPSTVKALAVTKDRVDGIL